MEPVSKIPVLSKNVHISQLEEDGNFNSQNKEDFFEKLKAVPLPNNPVES